MRSWQFAHEESKSPLEPDEVPALVKPSNSHANSMPYRFPAERHPPTPPSDPKARIASPCDFSNPVADTHSEPSTDRVRAQPTSLTQNLPIHAGPSGTDHAKRDTSRPLHSPGVLAERHLVSAFRYPAESVGSSSGTHLKPAARITDDQLDSGISAGDRLFTADFHPNEPTDTTELRNRRHHRRARGAVPAVPPLTCRSAREQVASRQKPLYCDFHHRPLRVDPSLRPTQQRATRRRPEQPVPGNEFSPTTTTARSGWRPATPNHKNPVATCRNTPQERPWPPRAIDPNACHPRHRAFSLQQIRTAPTR